MTTNPTAYNMPYWCSVSQSDLSGCLCTWLVYTAAGDIGSDVFFLTQVLGLWVQKCVACLFGGKGRSDSWSVIPVNPNTTD